MVIVWVKDLFFGSKIEAEARAHRASCCFVETRDDAVKAFEANDATLALIDLDASAKTLDAVRNIKSKSTASGIRIIGFLSHVEADLAKKAQMAGCDVVMPRSIFARSLPEIFNKYREITLTVQ